MPDDTYEKALEKDGRNLVALAEAGEIAPVDFRDTEIANALAELDRKQSVLLVGLGGVGKTAVVHGIARAMAERKRGALFEISTALLLAGTRYIGEWQTKVTRVASAAADAGAVLYVTDLWNLAEVGKTSSTKSTMLDALRPFLESSRLQILGEASHETLRIMQRTPSFVSMFRVIEIAPLAESSVDAALVRAANRRGTTLDGPSRRVLVDLTSRFLAAQPQPGPALTLLGEALDYQAEKRAIGEYEEISRAFVERVFSITSGLPLFVVSRGAVIAANEIRAWFADRVVGQTDAIKAVVEMIALFKAGIHDPNRPLGTFLFVGPTGVGKTELARALATFLFGSPQRLLRFDLSEFKDYSSFELLLGDPAHPDKPARLVDPVRGQPFQVVLFDELEKAHSNVWDLLLPLLDEGRLTTPAGDTVDFRNTIVVCTSNVGAQAAAKSVGFGATSDDGARESRTRSALEAAFRPELLNRFQHIVVFHPLSTEEMRRIARQEMERVLKREGIAGQHLVVDVDDEALDLVIREGVDARFGARALKRDVQRRLVLPLAMTLMESAVMPGSILKLTAKDGAVRVRVAETEESRAHKRDLEPARAQDGRAITQADIGRSIAELEQRLASIAEAVSEPEVESAREHMVKNRANPSFWKDQEASMRSQRDLARIETTLDRIRRLRERLEGLRGAWGRASDRAARDALARNVASLDEALSDAHREMVVLGWEGSADALVEIRPVGGSGREARDLLVELYMAWATYRRLPVDWICEPRSEGEAAMVAIKGLYTHGWLRAEAGLHRLRLAPVDSTLEDRGKLVVAAVRVIPWTEKPGIVMMTAQRPLKAIGQYGGKIRSRVEFGDLVFQSARTIAEHRELAAEIVGSWAEAPPWSDEVVRRYDRSPPLVRDALTGFSSGRPDMLAPRTFDTLLRNRIDATKGE